MDFYLSSSEKIGIYLNNNETEAIKIAARNLAADIKSVVNADAVISDDIDECKIIIGTKGISDFAKRNNHKEEFTNSVIDGKLYITGADRRGTIYGIYDFCESIGVSPWYWWADVPIKQKDEIHITDGFIKSDYPTVEYRGVFINDEEELENWVKAYIGEETIGVKTYERIFELLLRLKANYIWPAMHVNSFNAVKENGELADKMGIVVGTSHCDILMRSNNREWYPWLEGKGYTDIEYDYSIEGENRRILDEYWNDSIVQNKDFEVCYTLGMRGIHDWGSSMRAIDENTALSDSEKSKVKVEMLSFIIKSQRKLLADNGADKNMQIFIPYKEVLDMYDNGLEVPDDVTLVWVNDNFGYMRRYPDEAEQKRTGGNGLYYHVSYWAAPAMDYLFLNSTPLAHMKNELKKSYENGIQKLWVLNVGAIKPLEQEIEFFLRYAWEIGKGGYTDNTVTYLAKWVERDFTVADGTEIANVLTEFAQLTNVRKLEHMSYDLFSQYAYGDEGARRINKLADLYKRANAVYNTLPENEKDAFFQLVLMKIHASYFINCDYHFADRSYNCYVSGKLSNADYYTKLSQKADYYKREMLEYYNKVMSDGKWDKILTPEQYMPPVTAMHPPRTESLKKGENKLGVVLWDNESKLTLDRYSVNEKWFELFNPSGETTEYEITASRGINTSKKSGIFTNEERIFVTIDYSACSGEILIRSNSSEIIIPVTVSDFTVSQDFCGYIEADGYISMAADGYSKNDGWRVIPFMGRGYGNAIEGSNASMEYTFLLRNSGKFTAEIFRFPTLNSTGKIRMAMSVDGCEEIIVEAFSNDEHRGSWRENVMSNVDRLTFELPHLNSGEHTLKITAIDRYITFSSIVIYTNLKKNSYLAPPTSYHTEYGAEAYNEEIPQLSDDFYNMDILPRDTVYAGVKYWGNNGLIDSNIRKPLNAYPKRVKHIQGNMIYEQNSAIRIDAEMAVAQNENAFIKGGNWIHADSETGMSMYIREKGLMWTNTKTAPTLNYKIRVADGGEYHIWALIKVDENPASVAFGLDGKIQPITEQHNHGNVWSYEAKQIWRWVEVSDMDIPQGEHIFSVHAVTSAMRIDRIYLTKRSELPPDALEW